MEKTSISPAFQPAVSEKLGRCIIMIVDDVEENLDLLEDVLTEHGYETIRARNGLEALESLHGTSAHLIIADAMMPRMDGFELCKALKRNPVYAKIPFIIYTVNYVDKEDEEFARHIGVDRYVLKYAGLGALIDSVKELLLERYGPGIGGPSAQTQVRENSLTGIDDPTFLEKHHTMVVRKLEEKMAELEMYAETLNRRNRELQASEVQYRSLFEHTGVAIFVIDQRTGKVLDANKMGIALLRSSKEEILSLPSFPLAEKNGFLSALLQTTTYFSGETAIKCKDGEIVEVEIGAGPVAQPNDTRLILFVRDVTVQRKMRQQLMEAEKMMLMGCFATGIAHEIRNPLTAVTLNLQYLLEKYGRESAGREYVESALDATRHVSNVVESTLSLARRSPLTLRPEQINSVVRDSLRFVRIPLQEKNIKVELRLSDDLPLLEIDAREVQQALLNLLQNAIEVSPQGSCLTVATVLVKDRDSRVGGRHVEILIKDSGPGVRAEDVPHLFEPLRTTKSGGTGLGLALSRHIMVRHGGEISLEPMAEGGTTARLIFQLRS
jgi:PAS domain S-box-containing protein